MPNKEALRQEAKELETAVKDRLALFEKGEIEAGEFKQYMETADKRNEEIGTAIKTYDAAKAFRSSTDSGSQAAEQQQQELQTPDHLKKIRDTFAEMKSHAAGRQRGSFSMEFGMKSFLDDANLKTQGITGLSGANASGTSTPSALSGYFLGGTAGPAIAPEFIPGIIELQFYPNVIAQLFPEMPVSSPVVTYVREASWTNSAAAVNEGATKPTSTSSFTRYTEQIGKIANLSRVTDELIQDAAYVWALIQRRLVQGVQRKEEVELLAGSGYPGCNGLLNRSTGFTQFAAQTAVTSLVIPASGTAGLGAGTDTVASVTPGRAITGTGTTGTAPTGPQIAVGILQMLTDIRIKQLFEPDAVVLNPMDWVTVRLSTDANGQYMGGSFFGQTYGYPNLPNGNNTGAVENFTLWGKKTVTTPAWPAGYVLAGDFADAGAVLRHGGLRVDIANQNGTDFEQNLWTARAEERVGLLIERPELFELAVLKNAP
jgi:HK97 family phage major capsid protein